MNCAYEPTRSLLSDDLKKTHPASVSAQNTPQWDEKEGEVSDSGTRHRRRMDEPDTERPDPELVKALHEACEAGDTAGVRNALAAGCPAHAQETEHGRSGLMLAAGAGHSEIISLLLEAGAPWNAVDRRGACAGNYALDAGHQALVDSLVDVAVRAELLLGASERNARAAAVAAAANEDYLSRGVRYDGDRLIDDADDAVMMQWETPLMEAHARHLCDAAAKAAAARGEDGGGDVLNVGFGMGIIDRAISALSPRTQHIIEAHPAVYAKMVADGWTERPGVVVHFGRCRSVPQERTCKVATTSSPCRLAAGAGRAARAAS